MELEYVARYGNVASISKAVQSHLWERQVQPPRRKKWHPV